MKENIDEKLDQMEGVYQEERMLKKQVEFRLRSPIDGVNMLLIVSPEGGIKKKCTWPQRYKDLFYDKTKKRNVKIAISCNGTFCMNEKEWEHFKRCVESTMEKV